MTGHRALEKKQITQGNNRKVQNPSGSQGNRKTLVITACDFLLSFYTQIHAYGKC